MPYCYSPFFVCIFFSTKSICRKIRHTKFYLFPILTASISICLAATHPSSCILTFSQYFSAFSFCIDFCLAAIIFFAVFLLIRIFFCIFLPPFSAYNMPDFRLCNCGRNKNPSVQGRWGVYTFGYFHYTAFLWQSAGIACITIVSSLYIRIDAAICTSIPQPNIPIINIMFSANIPRLNARYMMP